MHREKGKMNFIFINRNANIGKNMNNNKLTIFDILFSLLPILVMSYLTVVCTNWLDRFIYKRKLYRIPHLYSIELLLCSVYICLSLKLYFALKLFFCFVQISKPKNKANILWFCFLVFFYFFTKQI